MYKSPWKKAALIGCTNTLISGCKNHSSFEQTVAGICLHTTFLLVKLFLKVPKLGGWRQICAQLTRAFRQSEDLNLKKSNRKLSSWPHDWADTLFIESFSMDSIVSMVAYWHAGFGACWRAADTRVVDDGTLWNLIRSSKDALLSCPLMNDQRKENLNTHKTLKTWIY